MPPTSRPRILVSSTIFDFRDLRSAVRFWLEELGYEVQLSEYNDFEKDLDLNSYDACLAAVQAADMFILLIGGRVGGWYDKEKRITITRAEYREARKRFEAGRCRLVVFVRREIWEVREDRKGLEKALAEASARGTEIPAAERDRIANHASRIVNDADFVFDFLEEVGRVEQMKANVLAPAEPRPGANWIHLYSDFRDIVDALSAEIGRHNSLRRAVVVANLRGELRHMASAILCRVRETVFPRHERANRARDRFSSDPRGQSSMEDQGSCSSLMMWCIDAGRPYTGPTSALDEAIRTGEFMAYDNKEREYRTTPIHDAMVELQLHLARGEELADHLARQHPLMLAAEAAEAWKGERSLTVENSRLVWLFALQDCYANITDLVKYLWRALETEGAHTPEIPTLRHTSPFEAMREEIERERVDRPAAEQWLNAQK